jgi:hypothetical protein
MAVFLYRLATFSHKRIQWLSRANLSFALVAWYLFSIMVGPPWR